MSNHPALPKIEVSKENKLYRVDWDYQEAPESDVLHRKNRDLTIFIDGVLVGMGIPEVQVSCASGRSGTVKKLDEKTANKLAEILEWLLNPLVVSEKKRIVAQESLPEYLRDKAKVV
ncbi:hypothetical protein [Pseudomonas fragi]|uniref:Uncharacterized protein n=1 Tax=Pseudomonas fragi TaxID=296 RepID=A0A9Q6YE50_PSEFR|nr:hypothetical protein [Pseudomonas fragi]QPL31915.1 hypothetical protein I5R27_01985 [Pseudomonas fragi]